MQSQLARSWAIVGVVVALAGSAVWAADPSKTDMQQQGTLLFRVSDLMNANAYDTQNQKLGAVKDLILNNKSGRIDFVVISSSEHTSGSGYVIVPFESLQPQYDAKNRRDQFVLNLTPSQFKDAPQLPRDNWNASLGSQQFLDQVHQFFSKTEHTTARPIQDQSQGQQPGNQPQK